MIKIYCANQESVSIVCTIKLKQTKGGASTVAKVKLNYIFNNPNSAEDTVEMLIKFFVEVNKPKVDEAIKKYAETSEETVSHSA